MVRHAGRSQVRRFAARAAWLGLALALVGCSSEAPRPVRPEYDLRDPGAARRLTAVSAVERDRDRAQVPVLIELLDDDDESVRMAAGGALKDLTGHDTGYRAFAPPAERRRQVQAWRAWWRGQGGAPAANAAATPSVVAPTAAPGYTSGSRHGRSP